MSLLLADPSPDENALVGASPRQQKGFLPKVRTLTNSGDLVQWSGSKCIVFRTMWGSTKNKSSQNIKYRALLLPNQAGPNGRPIMKVVKKEEVTQLKRVGDYQVKYNEFCSDHGLLREMARGDATGGSGTRLQIQIAPEVQAMIRQYEAYLDKEHAEWRGPYWLKKNKPGAGANVSRRRDDFEDIKWAAGVLQTIFNPAPPSPGSTVASPADYDGGSLLPPKEDAVMHDDDVDEPMPDAIPADAVANEGQNDADDNDAEMVAAAEDPLPAIADREFEAVSEFTPSAELTEIGEKQLMQFVKRYAEDVDSHSDAVTIRKLLQQCGYAAPSDESLLAAGAAFQEENSSESGMAYVLSPIQPAKPAAKLPKKFSRFKKGDLVRVYAGENEQSVPDYRPALVREIHECSVSVRYANAEADIELPYPGADIQFGCKECEHPFVDDSTVIEFQHRFLRAWGVLTEEKLQGRVVAVYWANRYEMWRDHPDEGRCIEVELLSGVHSVRALVNMDDRVQWGADGLTYF